MSLSGPEKAYFLKKHLRKALWKLPIGEPVHLTLSDDEFYQVFWANHDDLKEYDGILSIKLEAWGNTMYVTCPRLSGRPVLDD